MALSAGKALIAGTAGCAGAWAYEEAAGAGVAVDEKATNNGAYNGAIKLGVTGPNGKGLVSLTDGDYVSVAHAASLNTGDTFTLVWLGRRTRVHSSASYGFIDKGSGMFGFNYTGNKVRLRKNGTANSMESTPTVLDLHKEHLIVARKNAGTEQSIWIDGVKVALSTDTPQTFVNNTTGLSMCGGAANSLGGYGALCAVFTVAVSDQTIIDWAAACLQSTVTLATSVNRKYGFHQDDNYFGDTTPDQSVPAARALRSRVSRNSILPHLVGAGAVDPGVDDWSRHDRIFGIQAAQGYDIIGTFVGSPQWLNGSVNKFIVPGTGDVATDPESDATYKTWRDTYISRYIVPGVQRYKPGGTVKNVRMTKFELWNEPNLAASWNQGVTVAPSARYYGNFYVTARAAILAEYPAAQVYMGALGALGGSGGVDIAGVTIGAATGFLNQLTNTYGLDNTNVQYVSCHPYENGVGTGDPAVYTENQSNFQDLWRVHDWLQYKGIQAEVICDEFGWRTTPAGSFTQQQQSDNMVAALTMVRDYANWCGPVVYFCDTDNTAADWGVLTTSYTKKTAADVFASFVASSDKRTVLRRSGTGRSLLARSL